eukprot:4506791-Prymnesium_polylepis.3
MREHAPVLGGRSRGPAQDRLSGVATWTGPGRWRSTLERTHTRRAHTYEQQPPALATHRRKARPAI